MNNAHKSSRKRNKASDTLSKCFIKVIPIFFIPESNGSARNSSPANRLYVFQFRGNARTKVQETWDAFHTDRPMKDFGTLSQSNKVPHVSRTWYRLTVCCCFLHESGKLLLNKI